MSEAQSSATTTDNDPELEEIADQLYALRPEDFAAARDEHVRKAKADKKQSLARELGKLRRPTQSAWLINLLWRDQRDVMEQLFQLADELGRAQARASGRELQTLTVQRRELESGLLRHARGLAEKAGVSVSAPMEREAQETLSAALAVPEVANEVRTGRLVKPAAYAGFGAVPTGISPTAVVEEKEPPVASRSATTEPIDLATAQRSREQRAAAERQVQEARGAVSAAAESLADWERAAASAEERHQELRAQLEQLEKQLRDLRVAVATAEDAAQAAARRRDQADKAHETALHTLRRAEEDLKD
jgi:hypothetical protein